MRRRIGHPGCSCCRGPTGGVVGVTVKGGGFDTGALRCGVTPRGNKDGSFDIAECAGAGESLYVSVLGGEVTCRNVAL